jgi:hypothetical protein
MTAAEIEFLWRTFGFPGLVLGVVFVGAKAGASTWWKWYTTTAYPARQAQRQAQIDAQQEEARAQNRIADAMEGIREVVVEVRSSIALVQLDIAGIYARTGQEPPSRKLRQATAGAPS